MGKKTHTSPCFETTRAVQALHELDPATWVSTRVKVRRFFLVGPRHGILDYRVDHVQWVRLAVYVPRRHSLRITWKRELSRGVKERIYALHREFETRVFQLYRPVSESGVRRHFLGTFNVYKPNTCIGIMEGQ